jgi:hypothetical protein
MPGHPRHVVTAAPPGASDEEKRDAWRKLGRLFSDRRRSMPGGYTYRAKFAAERLPLTHRGNPNSRLVQDIELAAKDRIGHFTEDSLRLLTRAYGVTYESVLAVLRGEADELVPVVPAGPALAAAPPRGGPLPAAPESGLVREDAVRPYATPIWERLDYLRRRWRIEEPTGAQLAADPDGTPAPPRRDGTPLVTAEDIDVWDGSAGAMSLADRAWTVGDIRRRREARAANTATGTNGS